MTKHAIELADKRLVQDFLEGAGESLCRFRYFRTRSLEAIGSHLVTYVGTVGGKPVSYGHLDPCDGKVWLGVCVRWDDRGKGYGRKMMRSLLSFARDHSVDKVSLSVDRDNSRAIRMYESYGFREIPENESKDICFYEMET